MHLCLVPASALPWLIFLEQRQELAKLRRRSSLPEDEGDGKEYSLSRWTPGLGWLWGGQPSRGGGGNGALRRGSQEEDWGSVADGRAGQAGEPSAACAQHTRRSLGRGETGRGRASSKHMEGHGCPAATGNLNA